MLEYILIALITYAIILIVFGLIRELKLNIRPRINYSRFLRFKKYYNFKINKYYLILVYLFIILSTAFSIYIVTYSAYSLYIIGFSILNIFQLIFVYLHMSSVKYNEDLSIYNKYYYIIKNSFDNKELIAEQIKKYENTYQTLFDKNNTINRDFAKFFSSYNGIDDINDSLSPIKNVLDVYEQHLKRFDSGITGDFDHALQLYLKTGQQKSLNLQEFNLLDTNEFEHVLESINGERNKYIYQFVLNKLKEHQVVSVEHLLNLIEKLDTLKVPVSDELIIEIINYAYNRENKEKIITLLTDKMLLSVDILCNYVNVKDWSWIYDTPLNDMIRPKDGAAVFKSIIHNNAHKCAFKILTSLDHKFKYGIKQAIIDEEEINNEAKKMLVSIHNIISNGTFVNEASKYENMAVSLAHYYDDFNSEDTNCKNINEIIKEQTFEKSGNYIERTYNLINEQHKKEYLSAENTLFIYGLIKTHRMAYINSHKAEKLYTSFRKNLNFSEIKILELLLKTLILINEDDAKKINIIYPALEQTFKGKSKNMSIDEKRKNVAKTNIKYLTNTSNIKTFKQVLNRIENGRLILDKIVNL